jgi:hypothetical protein
VARPNTELTSVPFSIRSIGRTSIEAYVKRSSVGTPGEGSCGALDAIIVNSMKTFVALLTCAVVIFGEWAVAHLLA